MPVFDVVLLEDETGGYVVVVPALPVCHTQGYTLAEVMENAKEAIDLYWETLTAEEKRVIERKSCGYAKSESYCLKFPLNSLEKFLVHIVEMLIPERS
ncbi:MAG: type II toxin-antitoxin system HicB family antitoxin [Thermoproteota archaeon]|nr:type II toxin-antitoxin system HicB family antitoxin [Thermoproteota archaeon]